MRLMYGIKVTGDLITMCRNRLPPTIPLCACHMHAAQSNLPSYSLRFAWELYILTLEYTGSEISLRCFQSMG